MSKATLGGGRGQKERKRNKSLYTEPALLRASLCLQMSCVRENVSPPPPPSLDDSEMQAEISTMSLPSDYSGELEMEGLKCIEKNQQTNEVVETKELLKCQKLSSVFPLLAVIKSRDKHHYLK